jgi:hypothetical protein
MEYWSIEKIHHSITPILQIKEVHPPCMTSDTSLGSEISIYFGHQ